MKDNKLNKVGIIFLIFLYFSISTLFAQANLTIVNNSGREMTVKIMKGDSYYNQLHEKVYVSAWGSTVVYFNESGNYFTKSKAVLAGKNPIFRKGKPFYVTNDDTGYSILTLTFSIKESKIPAASGGVSISKQEFDKN